MIAPPVSGNPAGPVRDRAEGKCGIAVRVIRDLNELSEIRSIWENWQSHPNTDLDFYQTILRVRADIVRPHVMVVYGGGRPIALLAGRIEDKRVRFRAGYLTLLRPKLRLLTLPFGGFIGDATAQTAESVVREVIRSLRRGEADMAVFEPVDTRSALHEEVLNRVSWLCRDYLHTSQVHRTMTLQNSAELFQQSLSPKVRKNLKWQAKKILEDYGGAVEIRLRWH